jgi:thiamine monophosphate kinase
LPGGFVFITKRPGICQAALYLLQNTPESARRFCIYYKMPRNLPGDFVFITKRPGICQAVLHLLQNALESARRLCIYYKTSRNLPDGFVSNTTVFRETF